MPTISTADKFLGSLLGAYIGSSYRGTSQLSIPNLSDSQLYQWWHQDLSQGIPSLQLSNTCLISALPWLLYHHDDGTARHRTLLRSLGSDRQNRDDAIADRVAALYLLGDCLEWLIQDPGHRPNSVDLLCKHLQTQIFSECPPSLMQFLQPALNEVTTQSIPHRPATPSGSPSMRVAIALQQCLYCPENLALTLASSPLANATLAGCLLGAWGGTSIMPMPWKIAIPPTEKAALTHMAEQLYRTWAGIISTSTRFDVLPLNL